MSPMRVDVWLNKVCVLKSRTLAREACDRGKVQLNGAEARGSRSVKPGDRVRLDLGVRVLELEVLAVPEGNIPKRRAPEFYRVLQDVWVEEP